jgi:hypothetical protein
VQGRLDPAEPAADDDDMGAISGTGFHRGKETPCPRGTQLLIPLVRSSRPIVILGQSRPARPPTRQDQKTDRRRHIRGTLRGLDMRGSSSRIAGSARTLGSLPGWHQRCRRADIRQLAAAGVLPAVGNPCTTRPISAPLAQLSTNHPSGAAAIAGDYTAREGHVR